MHVAVREEALFRRNTTRTSGQMVCMHEYSQFRFSTIL